MKRALIMATVLLSLAACGSRDQKAAQPAGPDYSKMTSIPQVEATVPNNLKLSYQNLFSCTYETTIKQGKPAPELGPKYSIGILEAVKKDPAAGDKCLDKLRSMESEKADKKAPAKS